MRNLSKNPQKNNPFASSPAFPPIEAAAYRGDLEHFTETGDKQPVTDPVALDHLWREGVPSPWLYTLDAGGKEPNALRKKKLAPIVEYTDLVILCEVKADFLTTVFATGGIGDNGNTMLVSNCGDTLLDWMHFTSAGRNSDTNMFTSVVREKDMKALQEHLADADVLAMYMPDYLSRAVEQPGWWLNTETGRVEFSQDRYDAEHGGSSHD